MSIPASQVKELRDRTGAGMMDCKKALEEAGGDLDKAVELLRVRLGDKVAQGRRPRGHRGHRRSPTSTPAARSACWSRSTATPTSSPATTTSSAFARDIALHIAASPATQYVSEEEIPEDDKQAELRVFEQQAADKPENIRGKIAEGKLRKWMEEVVLLNQPHVNPDKYDGKTIEQLRVELAGHDRRERRDPAVRPLPVGA